MLLSIFILLVLTLLSGLLASSEIALSSSNRNKVKMIAEKGEKRAEWLLSTINKPHRFFATTQLYYTFIAFFSGAYAANVFTEPLAAFALRIGAPLSKNLMESVAFITVTVLLTYFNLILGELVPKRIAMRYAIPYALKVLPFLHVLSLAALPFVKLLSSSAKLVLKILRFKDDNSEAIITREELSQMVESSSEQGHIAESAQGMIENIFSIDQLTAGEICTHRMDIVALPLDADFKTAVDLLIGHHFSRIPVYEETLDCIRGFLHSKDVFHYMVTNPDHTNFDITTLMREAHFVPISKKADELFQEMRKERTNLAVVIDEYGGTHGIVTLEDVFEKIVGSIQDEYDIDELPEILPIGEKGFKIQGTTALLAVQNYFGVDLPVDEYETLSGFMVGQLGYIPSEDEKPQVTYNGLHFKAATIFEKRIAEVTVKKIPEETAEI
ncbi:MAG: hemolysin family protein [Treponema sp.]|nr:hemolysin family protein [Treponema sp.]